MEKGLADGPDGGGHLPHRAPIGWPYQVAASPLKMCQLESEGAGVSAVRAVRATAGEKTLQSQW